jgi:predicted  nucleic acid-binding Zn-ribbon protein
VDLRRRSQPRPARARRCALKADPTRQARLLDLQTLDTRLDQIVHARGRLPQLAAIENARRELSSVDTQLVNARTAAGDVQRELVKSDQDVQLVRDRAARNQSRLDAGQGTAKDLQALQHELASLARRQGELEDLELAVMERSEALEAKVAALDIQRTDLTSRLAALEAERDADLGDLAAEEEKVGSGRPDLVGEVGDDLVTLYEKIRTTSGGLAAAELKHRRCGGCRLELNNVDLARIRAAAPDEVVRCEECRRIMVRTPESGL